MDRRRLLIISKNDDVIKFADPEVERICVENWGSNGKITKDQAAAVTTLGTVFRNNTKITSFDELKYFTGVATISNNCFNGCTSLNIVNLSNIAFIIGDNAFKNTRLSGELTIKAQIIGCPFLQGTNVTKVILPRVINMKPQTALVAGCNFNDCPNLTIIDFGATLKDLQDANFGENSGLQTVIFRGDVINTSTDNFIPTGNASTAKYYVPDDYLSNWQTKFPNMTFKPFSEAPEGLL